MLNHCILGNFSCFLLSAAFFQNQLFQKILSGIPTECQTVWILIRPEDSSGLIWVQTVWQGNLQMTLVDKELMIFFSLIFFSIKAAIQTSNGV